MSSQLQAIDTSYCCDAGISRQQWHVSESRHSFPEGILCPQHCTGCSCCQAAPGTQPITAAAKPASACKHCIWRPVHQQGSIHEEAPATSPVFKASCLTAQLQRAPVASHLQGCCKQPQGQKQSLTLSFQPACGVVSSTKGHKPS